MTHIVNRNNSSKLIVFPCSAGCPPLTTPNGVFNPISNGMLGPGATVTLLCDEGFMPTGPVTVMCMNNLMWDPDPSTFVCNPVVTTGEENLNYTITRF